MYLFYFILESTLFRYVFVEELKFLLFPLADAAAVPLPGFVFRGFRLPYITSKKTEKRGATSNIPRHRLAYGIATGCIPRVW